MNSENFGCKKSGVGVNIGSGVFVNGIIQSDESVPTGWAEPQHKNGFE
jgi:hypothetical protein